MKVKYTTSYKIAIGDKYNVKLFDNYAFAKAMPKPAKIII
ncbi:hypothetical protein DDD_1866 [Nonlabens dokdonensis DSW-6]|uniref:Uncharacterized protein n=1 Tax=Nonlabens dokdonensis (strain DSM 17205 / KCTC 12402 / DSW-6) TaxID=592029 RepID=L7WDM4_NONDD|nr:hypothetical protein DDD_1866 [Nonlabens dokdonensis DSW-6]